MKLRLLPGYVALCLATIVGCGKNNPSDAPAVEDEVTQQELSYVEPDWSAYTLKANYETSFLYFESSAMEVSIVENPRKLGADKSRRCTEVVTAGGKWDFVRTSVKKPLDFTANPAKVALKVLAPSAGLKLVMRLEASNTFTPTVSAEAVTKCEGIWEDIVFDFGGIASNRFVGIVLVPDAGGESLGEKWYFDEIRIPDDDLSGISLFRRVENNPVMSPDRSYNWMNKHIANAAILGPKDSRDGNWWMYPRGGNDEGGSREQIGVFTQDAASFNPLGPWKPYSGNPVIPYGKSGSYDEWRVLDGAPVVGPDGLTYLYYKARRFDGTSSIGLAWSEDGFNFTKAAEPWMKGGSPTDALFHDGKYYVFRGTQVDVLTDPKTREGCQTFTTIMPGGAPSNFDDKVLWGCMVFRLEGVDKWFMAYQGSSFQYDFPDRFHLALSDDLINWTKVQNNQPLFSRGSAGEWDQGGIWYPEIFEYQDVLYLYYEGWGCEGYISDRDSPYFVEGNSCVGAATCSKSDFLAWCGLVK